MERQRNVKTTSKARDFLNFSRPSAGSLGFSWNFFVFPALAALLARQTRARSFRNFLVDRTNNSLTRLAGLDTYLTGWLSFYMPRSKIPGLTAF